MSSAPVDTNHGPFVVPYVVDRLIALGVAAFGVYLFVILFPLDPDARGYGTHEQLGMPPCGWPVNSGVPCPTCGVTTSATHLIQLSVWSSLKAHAFGTGLAVVGVWQTIAAAIAIVRNRPYVAWLARLPYGTLSAIAIVLLFASWGLKWWGFE